MNVILSLIKIAMLDGADLYAHVKYCWFMSNNLLNYLNFVTSFFRIMH